MSVSYFLSSFRTLRCIKQTLLDIAQGPLAPSADLDDDFESAIQLYAITQSTLARLYEQCGGQVQDDPDLADVQKRLVGLLLRFHASNWVECLEHKLITSPPLSDVKPGEDLMQAAHQSVAQLMCDLAVLDGMPADTRSSLKIFHERCQKMIGLLMKLHQRLSSDTDGPRRSAAPKIVSSSKNQDPRPLPQPSSSFSAEQPIPTKAPASSGSSVPFKDNFPSTIDATVSDKGKGKKRDRASIDGPNEEPCIRGRGDLTLRDISTQVDELSVPAESLPKKSRITFAPFPLSLRPSTSASRAPLSPSVSSDFTKTTRFRCPSNSNKYAQRFPMNLSNDSEECGAERKGSSSSSARKASLRMPRPRKK